MRIISHILDAFHGGWGSSLKGDSSILPSLKPIWTRSSEFPSCSSPGEFVAEELLVEEFLGVHILQIYGFLEVFVKEPGIFREDLISRQFRETLGTTHTRGSQP